MNAVPHFPRYAKVVVVIEHRDDGGLRAYSNDVPGFVLSHRNPEAVISDIGPALERILSAMWGVEVKADPLPQVGAAPEDEPSRVNVRRSQEYVAHVC
jgi:hypothetical protein